jgi:YrbI family 3-deoxy-D-manno-octulosonate 8-phosphate phosphatase
MSVLAMIPARGGSRGIPRKNVKLLCGKPLIAWTIEAAKAASSVTRVVVSTDDEEIADVSSRFGAEVVRRPPEISGALASSESALLHVLDALREREGYEPETIAFLQCTSPLTMPEDIDGTVRLVAEEGLDSAVTMVPFHYFLWREGAGGKMEGVNHVATRRLMRQDRETEYLEVGAVYAMRTEGLRTHQFRFFGRIGRYLLPAERAFEIDDPEDWPRAEMLLSSSGKERWLFDRSRPFARVRALVTDFDGVMTDNRVVVDQEGHEAVVCHRGDGWGIALLKQAGVAVACISTEENPVVRARCQKLDIPYWQGQQDKLLALDAFLAQAGIEARDCVYVGNDTNDAACLEHAGLAVVPRDAAPEVLPLADWQTDAAGGAGVIREITARILEERQSS